MTPALFASQVDSPYPVRRNTRTRRRIGLCAAFAVVACRSGLAADAPAVAIDYADAAQVDQWLHHPVYGDVSYDTFVHSPINPIHRGSPPYDWPVNGSLFRDPVGGGWYLYVGHYLTGYKINAETPTMCTVFASHDQGRTWKHVGPVFADQQHVYDGETSCVFHAPDVAVFFADGRYHMCFDWCSRNTTWANAANPPPAVNSGVGYAWSDRPQGPFHITKRPVASTRDQKTLLGKYRRLYISTMIRRKSDWLVLTDTDSGPYFGWALLGMTAPRPEGPYSEAKLLLHPESARFHPPVVEFNPAFTHDGFVYMPATSVAANRNFQVLFRAPIEQADDPVAWTIARHGSLWHAEPLENEHAGIWGQTFSGFVGPDGIFNVFFPSLDSKNVGNVNVASRPWNKPMRERGFVVSGHAGPSLCYLKTAGPPRRVEADLDARGTVAVIWNAPGVLGVERCQWPFPIHPMCLASHAALELAPKQWSLVQVNSAGGRGVIATGPRDDKPRVQFALEWTGGEASLTVNGGAAWRGTLPSGPGNMGLLCSPASHALVRKLAVSAVARPATLHYLFTDAIIGAAEKADDWTWETSDRFRFGIGAVSKRPGQIAKWNFEGSRVSLWAPKSPAFGKAELILDGRNVATVDFGANREIPSATVFEMDNLPPALGHAVMIRAGDRPIPIDSVEVGH